MHDSERIEAIRVRLIAYLHEQKLPRTLLADVE
jgi:hypothetical protein